ncbi:MAG TPA: hypothetical protein DDW94_03190 [Deltaproteobacteria bacterium]|nr:MAG: hypothetical protein A2Z79_09885 [Deltaproteobacteria bacterium GWA2_55_82]OGQ62490.1 MAG: hypothetical protein A3I81_08390 [Deltaproteobacteria bacterium RIFCSPLOWO2_02_FULL_55_12]OIJ73017.1 MAG: hypothetical protein A2V21_301325 [Deltaproteobacteria bacterium GWC2_55_46]HBG45973.1 hypothetical protein [Deltaproteobacteria bacterium]HCY11809.1 hypothetical protein [Deltaproteobacteria bacterium]
MRRENGFTLIETLMVIVLLGIMGTGLIMYFVGLGSSNQAIVIEAVALAQEKMEKIKADVKSAGFDSIVSEAAATLPAPFDRFTREVQAQCVEEADLDAASGAMPGCSDSDIKAKRVVVTVSWPGGSTEVTTVITDH